MSTFLLTWIGDVMAQQPALASAMSETLLAWVLGVCGLLLGTVIGTTWNQARIANKRAHWLRNRDTWLIYAVEEIAREMGVKLPKMVDEEDFPG